MGHIQIRNVPPDLHRKLKAKAAARGVSLSDYLLRVVEEEASQLSAPELLERIRRRDGKEKVREDLDVAEIIRDEREAREEELYRRVSNRRR